MAAARLVKGAVFKTFSEFEEHFKEYQYETKEIFVKRRGKLIKTFNKSIKIENNKFNEDLVYKS